MSPDGGDGALEALYLITLLVVIAAVICRPLRRWLGQRWLNRQA